MAGLVAHLKAQCRLMVVTSLVRLNEASLEECSASARNVEVILCGSNSYAVRSECAKMVQIGRRVEAHGRVECSSNLHAPALVPLVRIRPPYIR